jgi:hypothetical protein
MDEPEFVHDMLREWMTAIEAQWNLSLVEGEPLALHPEVTSSLTNSMEDLDRVCPEFLTDECHLPLGHRLFRNLADGILERINEPSVSQSFYVGYELDAILELFERRAMYPDFGTISSAI